ncbi:hypothetical protein JMUB5695_00779 [Mycobacterium heckeshornense]|uniref:hypothetical protein n=1 Tax=Mycobacterium heckeshornense TaxID=110505 RepID=UPI001AFAB10F|nr:hypothetical protein [Mycobacterium heckeshornense]BCQ07358.1 hypothetical protein JMUB5695_00779 [Mycobacterium heckeshornense]
MVGVEDLHRGRAIVAVVAPSQGCEPDPGELRQYVRKSLREFSHTRPGDLLEYIAHQYDWHVAAPRHRCKLVSRDIRELPVSSQ